MNARQANGHSDTDEQQEGEQQEGEQQMRGSGGWRFDKHLNVGHILTTLMLAAGMFSWGSAVERRIAVIEVIQSHYAAQQKEQDDRLEIVVRQIRDDFAAMRSDIRDHTAKLDRLIETTVRQPR